MSQLSRLIELEAGLQETIRQIAVLRSQLPERDNLNHGFINDLYDGESKLESCHNGLLDYLAVQKVRNGIAVDRKILEDFCVNYGLVDYDDIEASWDYPIERFIEMIKAMEL